jgi:hypothetical protein
MIRKSCVLRAAGTHDVADLRVDVAKNHLVLISKAHVVNLKKRIAVSAALGHWLSSQMVERLSFLELQARVGEKESLGEPQHVVLQQSNHKNCDLNRKHSLQPKMLVLIEEQSTHATFGA